MIEGKYVCHIVMDFDEHPGDHEYMQFNIDMMRRHLTNAVMTWFVREFANREDVDTEHGRFALVVDMSYKIIKQM